MATYIIYPEVDGYAGAFSSNLLFGDLRDADGTHSNENSNTMSGFRIQSHSVFNEYNYIRRGLLFFDTSVIESTDAPIQAIISLTLDSKVNDWSFDPFIGIYSHVGSHNTFIDNNDYQKCTNTIMLSSIQSLNTWAVGTTRGHNFSAGKLSFINKEGYSTFCIREVSHDANNSAPTWENNKDMQAWIRSSEYTGTTSDPVLVVPTTASPLNAGVKVGDQFYGLLAAHVNVGESWLAVDLGDVKVTDWAGIL